jgi:hypothetical protein
MSEDAPKAPPESPATDEPQPLSLRDAEVAPPRKTLAEILDGLPVQPGVSPFPQTDRRDQHWF